MQLKTTITIALADDHALVRNFIKDLLINEGFDVIIEAENGKELLEMLQHLKSLPDLCLTDIRMPVMDGFQLTAELKRRYQSIKIIAYSMNTDDATVKKIITVGADGFFPKDEDPEKLKKLINKLCPV